MRQPLHSESQQIGLLPGDAPPSVSRSADTATLDLLSAWQNEDATSEPAELKTAEAELSLFMKAVNASRSASGERLVYP